MSASDVARDRQRRAVPARQGHPPHRRDRSRGRSRHLSSSGGHSSMCIASLRSGSLMSVWATIVCKAKVPA